MTLSCLHQSLPKESGVYYTQVESDKCSRTIRIAFSVPKACCCKGVNTEIAEHSRPQGFYLSLNRLSLGDCENTSVLKLLEASSYLEL